MTDDRGMRKTGTKEETVRSQDQSYSPHFNYVEEHVQTEYPLRVIYNYRRTRIGTDFSFRRPSPPGEVLYPVPKSCTLGLRWNL